MLTSYTNCKILGINFVSIYRKKDEIKFEGDDQYNRKANKEKIR